MAEDDKVDVRRAKAEKAKSADGGLVRAEGKKAAKARQAVPAGTVGVRQIVGREAGVEQDALTPVGFEEEAGDADDTLATTDLEQPEIKDVKPGDLAGKDHGGRSCEATASA